MNVAVTDLLAFMVTVHEPVPEHAPDHPENVDPRNTFACKVTTVPAE